MKLAAIKNLRKSYGDREILNIEKFENSVLSVHIEITPDFT